MFMVLAFKSGNGSCEGRGRTVKRGLGFYLGKFNKKVRFKSSGGYVGGSNLGQGNDSTIDYMDRTLFRHRWEAAPEKTTITSIKVTNKGILYVSYKKIKKNCKGYQVQLSTKKN